MISFLDSHKSVLLKATFLLSAKFYFQKHKFSKE